MKNPISWWCIDFVVISKVVNFVKNKLKVKLFRAFSLSNSPALPCSCLIGPLGRMLAPIIIAHRPIFSSIKLNQTKQLNLPLFRGIDAHRPTATVLFDWRSLVYLLCAIVTWSMQLRLHIRAANRLGLSHQAQLYKNIKKSHHVIEWNAAAASRQSSRLFPFLDKIGNGVSTESEMK